MPDRPIIFSAPMVRALLDGRKTQTRRVLKPQPPADAHMVRCYTDNPPRPTLRNTVGWFVPEAGDLWPCNDEDRIKLRYAPGDRLWVKETHAFDGPLVRYYATDHVHELRRKRSSIHMPRWASRLTLTVTEVRVQRLQEISAEDCIAEGVPCSTCDAARSVGRSACNGRGCFEIKRNFRDLWTSIHGDAAWDQNPWVTAISFTVERRNIDA